MLTTCWKMSGRLLLIVNLAAFLPALVAAETAKPGGTVAQQREWHDGLTLLETGKFDQASKLIHGAAARGDSDEQIKQVSTWVAAFEKQQGERAKRVKQDYDRYVGWVKEDTEKKWWNSAVWHCDLAFNNAPDPDAFRKEPWLLKAIDGAIAAAKEYEKAGKWVKAASIYARAGEIFPLDKTYREALDRCQAHIRLTYTYTPDSDWKANVNDIQPEMARDAFRKIDSEYLKEPVFKDAIVAGLKQVLRLAQEPKLEKQFKGLTDKTTVKDFCTRLETLLKHAQDKDTLKVGDLISTFNRVIAINEETELLPPNVLIYEFVQGALQPLDRFSDMIWPADAPEFNKHTQGRFSGVGIQIRKGANEPIMVVSPLEDTPAYRAGVQPNDIITKINGKSAKTYTITQAVRDITGPAGTKVTLTFKRAGVEKEFDMELERQEITIYTLRGYERDAEGKWNYLIDPKQRIAYMRITNFTEGTIEELKDAIDKLKHDEGGLHGLILDLRGNPGGPLKAAVDVSGVFLRGDKQIVSTRDRHDKEWATSGDNDVHYTDFPLIIVANRTSASASEIVTGALQVHQRAWIVGERTFGKGSVQQVLRLDKNQTAFLKLTTAHYYLPDGRCLHREEDSTTWGVDPDVEIKLTPKEIVKALEQRSKTDILKGVNQKTLSADDIKAVTEYKPSTKPAKGDTDVKDKDAKEKGEDTDEDENEVKRDDPNNFPEIDPQLDGALMLMRVRLASDQPWPARTAKMAANAAPKAGG